MQHSALPPKFFEELEKNLRIYSFLKNKFKNKNNDTDKSIKKKYNYEEFQRLKQYGSEENFLAKVSLLGFKSTKAYRLFGKSVSLKQQAIDFIELYFNFDSIMQQVIEDCTKNKTKIRDYYKYISYIGD